ncbi:hypothetical protein FOZ63_026304 [Perkinsus olseni]|uniref:Uncharacterized protein n=1 Tax=Perkinsus olseni TaxID=32597 RepID=A0A7J6QZ27_PEROL|nr:hypothetical protein FOZ63_026304 [Perkinsus olseni]
MILEDREQALSSGIESPRAENTRTSNIREGVGRARALKSSWSRTGLPTGASGSIDHLFRLLEPPMLPSNISEFRSRFSVLMDMLKVLEVKEQQSGCTLRKCNLLRDRLKEETQLTRKLTGNLEALNEELSRRQDLLYSRLSSISRVEQALASAAESNEKLRERMQKRDAQIEKTERMVSVYTKRVVELREEIERRTKNEDTGSESSESKLEAGCPTSRSISSGGSSPPPPMCFISNMLGSDDSASQCTPERSPSEISLVLGRPPDRVELIEL